MEYGKDLLHILTGCDMQPKIRELYCLGLNRALSLGFKQMLVDVGSLRYMSVLHGFKQRSGTPKKKAVVILSKEEKKLSSCVGGVHVKYVRAP